jgi:hypothetical protein
MKLPPIVSTGAASSSVCRLVIGSLKPLEMTPTGSAKTTVASQQCFHMDCALRAVFVVGKSLKKKRLCNVNEHARKC